ncbi:MAG: UDP-N-acetylmuramoyl-tripeptide--D-alanyl-D-alanine ligase, partial [Saprospiraceae bacterium]|nr:UDP-N-acetylmuramoyl-tripeptide--D-alanyl-D-alanine ligase [Saprospiraceae bacterium]
ITGSNGKTTTKELCYEVVRSSFKCYATQGNYNNHIGVPITLFSTPRDVEVLIVEMGANHQGEIDFLSNISNPDIGIITNIGKAHLEGFGGIEGVKKGKSELYRFIAQKNGTIIYNGTDEVLTSLIPEGCKEIISYNPAKVIELNPSIKLSINDYLYESHLFGNYNAINIQCAVTLGNYLDIDHELMQSAISNYKPSNNRSEITTYKGATIIKDAYNANPSSVQLSLKNFVKAFPENSFVIIGDMLELGEEAVIEHSNIIDLVHELGIQEVIFIGPIFKSIDHSFPSFTSAIEASEYFNRMDLKGKNILLKGSRGLKLEVLLDD